jgi:hypothetical protein
MIWFANGSVCQWFVLPMLGLLHWQTKSLANPTLANKIIGNPNRWQTKSLATQIIGNPNRWQTKSHCTKGDVAQARQAGNIHPAQGGRFCLMAKLWQMCCCNTFNPKANTQQLT